MARVLITRPGVQDALISGVLTATSLVGVLVHLHVDLPEGGADLTVRPLDGLAIILVLLQTLPLVWRRRTPVAVLAVTSGAMLLYFRLGYFPSFASLGFLVALYTVAAERPRRTSLPAAAATGLVLMIILVIGREPVEPDTIIAEALIVGAAWSLGEGLRLRRGQVVQLEDRASRLEREREEWARQAVARERRVIARELHDVVAHNVSVIVAQSAAAQRVANDQPAEAVSTLAAIEHAGRAALVEMRRLMGLLRTETDRRGARFPQPGLDHVEALVAQVREAGLPVVLRIEGRRRPLPAGLDLSAFRIVQEALTNAMKHAGPARTEVVVVYEEDRLLLTVDDDGFGRNGNGASMTRPRYGHLGMRERVALFGGTLTVGPRVTGGYRVAACLPLDGESS
jgi:signal transduction histidine kinase